MDVYINLDDALRNVANRSFPGDCIIYPAIANEQVVAWTVEDDSAHMSDEWYWSYDNGIHDRDSVTETSGLFDLAEYIDSADDVRKALPEVIEQLESGSHCVQFAYAIVNDADVTCDDNGYPVDYIAGWILVAKSYPLD